MSVEFCDTNVLVYAHDPGAGERRTQARALLSRLWESGEGALSLQVLQELYVVLTRKLRSPLLAASARDIVGLYSTWRVIEPSLGDLQSAIDMSMARQIAFWDALLVVTAQRASSTILWSEDLNDGQVFGSTTITNPFRT